MRQLVDGLHRRVSTWYFGGDTELRVNGATSLYTKYLGTVCNTGTGDTAEVIAFLHKDGLGSIRATSGMGGTNTAHDYGPYARQRLYRTNRYAIIVCSWPYVAVHLGPKTVA